MTRKTNTSKNSSIVDERSATSSESKGFSTDTDPHQVRAVNDELLATLAEVEP